MNVLSPEDTLTAVAELKRKPNPLRALASLIWINAFNFKKPDWKRTPLQERLHNAGFEPYCVVTSVVPPFTFLKITHFLHPNGFVKFEASSSSMGYISTVLSDGSGVTSCPAGRSVSANDMRVIIEQTGDLERDLENHIRTVTTRAQDLKLDVMNYREPATFKAVYWTHNRFRASLPVLLMPWVVTLLIGAIVVSFFV